MAFFLLSSHKPVQGLPPAADGHLGSGHSEATRTIADLGILNVLSEAQLIDYKRFTILCVCNFLVRNAVGAALSGNVYVVDCGQINQLPTLIYTFQGFELSLLPEQYVQERETRGPTQCFSSIVSDPGIRNEDMVLGMSSMEHFLTMFDQETKSVGFQPRLC
ncbi:hypothetical protein T265_11672 [Opisthorchis viverrini]|uniref:Peptidase A1 domain-containing protein n=1 Tax=Opisthorchis viverrini TaxID=6198 RepID=A0A074YY55_OPIVI|nr:hypothetical protein T265_11672 [Opisthorchis viverrini]KER19603.1 hypothetical protein T265_11672 [Opisthorchis viverrini]